MIHDLEQVHSLPVMRSAVVQILGIFVHPHLCYTPVVLKVQVLKKLLIHLTSKEHCEETNEADFKLYTWKKKLFKNHQELLLLVSPIFFHTKYEPFISSVKKQSYSNFNAMSTCTFILTSLVLSNLCSTKKIYDSLCPRSPRHQG